VNRRRGIPKGGGAKRVHSIAGYGRVYAFRRDEPDPVQPSTSCVSTLNAIALATHKRVQQPPSAPPPYAIRTPPPAHARALWRCRAGRGAIGQHEHVLQPGGGGVGGARCGGGRYTAGESRTLDRLRRLSVRNSAPRAGSRTAADLARRTTERDCALQAQTRTEAAIRTSTVRDSPRPTRAGCVRVRARRVREQYMRAGCVSSTCAPGA
jgi:hypothetical protein